MTAIPDNPAEQAPPPRRMTPDARRRQIIKTTQRLLIERPGEALSTADVAEAAGVTRALVHHYFKGIDELRHAVALDIAEGTPTILNQGVEVRVVDRVRHNIASMLDVIDFNRHVWLATLAAEGGSASYSPASEQAREIVIEQMLSNNADVIQDTPWTRLCLTGYFGFSDTLCRQWVLGRSERADVEEALVQTLLRLLLEVIPEGAARRAVKRSRSSL